MVSLKLRGVMEPLVLMSKRGLLLVLEIPIKIVSQLVITLITIMLKIGLSLRKIQLRIVH